jgi:phosphoribosylaminoimidazole-succinocarboxamide synthase
MAERESLANNNALPVEMLMDISETYLSIAETIIGKKLQLPENPRSEIIDTLSAEYNLIL